MRHEATTPGALNITADSWADPLRAMAARGEQLRAAIAECFRVLAAEGVLIFKWNETQVPVSEVLALTPHKPLIGHRRVGKSADTHWITFLKGGAA